MVFRGGDDRGCVRHPFCDKRISAARQFSVTYAETTSAANLSERAQRMMADINQRYAMLVLMIGSGILLIAISIAVYQLF